MQKDLLKLLKKILAENIGVEAEKLTEILFNKKNINEFLIAKKLNLTINQTRNILYRLGDKGLVRFVRKKDKKKGGWYTYFWTLQTEKCLSKAKEKIESKITELQEQLKNRKIERFFFCQNCDIEYQEENALLNNYTCPECGETLKMKESEKIINEIKKELREQERNLELINQELKIIHAKEEKDKEKRLKKEAEEKEKIRKAKARARKKEKEKNLRGKSKKKLEKKKSKPKKPVKKKTKNKKSLMKILKRLTKKK